MPLQSPSQGGTLLVGGNCNILTSGAVLSVEGFGGRASQPSDRSCRFAVFILEINFVVNFKVTLSYVYLVCCFFVNSSTGGKYRFDCYVLLVCKQYNKKTVMS